LIEGIMERGINRGVIAGGIRDERNIEGKLWYG
jgi:hypothetical protein